MSEYIRRKYAKEGYVSCVTCGTTRRWNDSMDAGHFIPKSRGDSVRYVEDNVHPQCKGCNLQEGGRFEDYYPYMVQTYGQARVDELTRLSKTTVKLTLNDLEDLIDDYQNKLNRLPPC